MTMDINKYTSAEEAQFILNKFADRANRSGEGDMFTKCANIVYGERKEIFEVKKDSSNRMYFKCTSCNKDLNNTRSLSEHAKSGNHLKIVENDRDLVQASSSKRFNVQNVIYSDKHTLQYKLSQAKTIILGLQNIEEYRHSNGKKSYFVCTICPTHGTIDEMYEHLIGNDHTDTYIRSKLVLNNPKIITNEEREYLKDALRERDHYSIENITIFKDPRYYPHQLEDDRNTTPSRSHNDEYYSPVTSHSHQYSSDGGVPVCVKNEKVSIDYSWECDSDDDSAAICSIQTTAKSTAVTTCDIGCMTSMEIGNTFEERMTVLCNIITAHEVEDVSSRLNDGIDMVVCLRLMFACLHYLYYTCSIKNATNQTKIIRKCMGRIKLELVKLVQEKFNLKINLTPHSVEEINSASV